MRKQISTVKSANARIAVALLSTALIASLGVTMLASCSSIPGLVGVAKKQVEGVVVPQQHHGKQLHVWLVKPQGEELTLTVVERSAFGQDKIAVAVEELLRGPNESEIENGIASEIPKGTILLGVERKDDEIVLNLSRRFASGSGPTSMETRLEQLSKTVGEVAGSNKVYLNVEGERLTAAAADGLEIQQPIY